MKINRKNLKNALELVKPGLASSDNIIEQATSFCFMDGFVVTYNDELSIRYPIDVELTGAVNANELYGFVNKISTEEINMDIEGNELLLKAGRSKAALTLQSEILLPIEELGTVKDWHDLPKDFWKAVNFVRASCSSDMIRPVLTCVHVNGDVVEGTDNLRVAQANLEEPMPIPSFLLPAKLAGTISRLRPNQIAEGKGWIHFKTKDEAIISCRTFSDDKFVNTDKVWKMEGAEVKFPSQMLEILEKASVFAKRDSAIEESVTIDLHRKKLVVSSQSETGRFEEPAKVAYDGEPIKFSIVLYLLKDILSDTDKAELSDNKLLFQGENWKYLTLLRS